MIDAALYAAPATPSSPAVPAADVPLTLLGGISPAVFMRKYWHKQPLLVRGAFPSMAQGAPISRDALFQLADDEDVESRLIAQTRQSWRMAHGPFAADDLPSLRRKAWTLLVQGVNLHHPAADQLMQQFRFVPDARLDDVMISYATDGGGVGPHFDSYDVFLIQAHGKRRWQISAQKDLTLQAGVPLKILQNFSAEQEWVLEPGDMLYLPPRYAHDGVAVGECMTWSVGFRAPEFTELTGAFLHWLAEDLADHPGLQGRYADAQQCATETPAALPERLVEALQKRLAKIEWDTETVQRFLGAHLTEPKPQVFFTPPAQSLSPKQLVARMRKQGLRLSARTLCAYEGKHFFINGEAFICRGVERAVLQRLANQRYLSPSECGQALPREAFVAVLCDWFAAGWVV